MVNKVTFVSFMMGRSPQSHPLWIRPWYRYFGFVEH